MPLPLDIVEKAKVLLADVTLSWADVAARLDVTEHRLRCDLHPGYAEYCRRKSRASKYALQDRVKRPPDGRPKLQRPAPQRRPSNSNPRCVENGYGMTAAGIFPAKTEPPARVLAERDRLAAFDLTIGQALLGDPLPGRSALDRRRETGADA